MRNQLWHTVGMHTMGFTMCRSYNIALYTILLSAIDDEILLLPVRDRHVKNEQIRPMFAYTIILLCGEYYSNL